MIDTEMIRNWLWLHEQIDNMEKTFEELKKQREELGAKIHNMLASEGAGKVNVDGVTVFPVRNIRARSAAGCMHNLIEGFKQLGEESMVTQTINAQKLSSYVKQYDPEDMMGSDQLKDMLPAEIRDYVNVYEQLTLGYRRTE